MKRLLGFGAFYLLVAVIVFYAVFPFYYAIISSLKPSSQLFRVDYFPVFWVWDNYVSVFREQPFAINILIIHALGDAISPLIIGFVADLSSLQLAFVGVTMFIPLSGLLWLAGAKYLDEDTRRADVGVTSSPSSPAT